MIIFEMKIVCLIVICLPLVLSGRASDFTRQTLRCDYLNALDLVERFGTHVYVYDYSGYFLTGATSHCMRKYIYYSKNERLAVLNLIAQELFESRNEYSQFMNATVFSDDIGYYVPDLKSFKD